MAEKVFYTRVLGEKYIYLATKFEHNQVKIVGYHAKKGTVHVWNKNHILFQPDYQEEIRENFKKQGAFQKYKSDTCECGNKHPLVEVFGMCGACAEKKYS